MAKKFKEKQIEQKETIESVTNAIKHILNMNDVKEKHKKKLLSLMIWFLTEADGLTAIKRTNYKYKLTYISEGAYNKRNKDGEDKQKYIKGLVHEHVYTRNSLIERLLEKPKQINSILKNAIGCIVTKEEDKKLREVDKTKTCNGWSRYKEANIDVYKRVKDQIGNEKFEQYKF